MNLKKLGRYLRVNLLGPGPRLLGKKDKDFNWEIRIVTEFNF